MSSHSRSLLLSAVFGLFLFASCSPKLTAVVTDRSGQHREIANVTTNRGKKLEILDGQAFRAIPLSSIQTLLIAPTPTHSRSGELYYSAELWLTDSSKILSYQLSDGTYTEAFVNITPTLLGRTSGGSYEMPLKDIRQIRIQQVKRSWSLFKK